IVFRIPGFDSTRQDIKCFYPVEHAVSWMSNYGNPVMLLNMTNHLLRISEIYQGSHPISQNVHAALTFKFKAGDKTKLIIGKLCALVNVFPNARLVEPLGVVSHADAIVSLTEEHVA